MFTVAAIKRLQPRSVPYRTFEGGEIPGFCLQVQPSGSRTYDRHGYLEEKRAALLQGERELRARLAGENVRALRAGGRGSPGRLVMIDVPSHIHT